VVVCPNCGEENPERARFCLNCASPLGGAIPAALEERKTVTVLFCDLVGFTTRAERSDPEDVRELLDAYQAALRREIERFDGTVEKFIGDAVVAVFGAPVAHEDDPERAVRAALRILGTVAELNESRLGLELAVRIGVNTGEALVSIGSAADGRISQGQGIATGDVVNTASRLQGVAPEGGIVVGELTYRATKDVIEYLDLEPVSLKGKAEPVAIWQVQAARSRQGVDIDQRGSTPFLGRGHELALLRETFRRTVDESSLQLVTVTGEPGVGKSRLIWEFKSALDDDPEILAFWRQGRCLPYGEGITFWALGEMVKSHAGILESDGPEEAEAKLAIAVSAVIDDARQAEWVKSRLSALVGLATDQVDRAESFAAWRTFLEAVTTRGPLVLVFEDVHWADDALIEFVNHLADWSTDVPILVVCTARPELYERHPDWAGGKRNATTLALSGLSDDDTARLVFALLAQVALPAEIQAALLDRAGGNPLFAQEYVRMLLDRGILQQRGRTLSMAPDAEIPLPETIQAAIAARLDTLTPTGKSLIHDAAVLGKVFWSGAVASIGGVDDRAADAGLHELARKELVRRSRTSTVEGQVEYAFWHALIRDVAYGQIPRAARARKHELAAGWIKAVAGDRVGDVSELLAYHYERALALSAATGLEKDVEGLRARALEALELAGDRAMSLDTSQAYELYRRALELAPPGARDRGRLLVRVVVAGGGSFGGSGRLEPFESERLLTEAVQELRSAADPVGLGGALTVLARQLWFRGVPEAGYERLMEAVAVLESAPPSRELDEAYAELAARNMTAGRMHEGRPWAAKALDLAQKIGARDIYARALQSRGTFDLALDGDMSGMADLQEALTVALESGNLSVIETAYDNLADFSQDLDGPEKSLALYREGIEFVRRRGGVPTWLVGESTWPLFSLGRWDEVLRVADEVIEADRDGPTHLTGLVLPERARVMAYRGRPGEARALISDFLPRARELRDPQIFVKALVAGAIGSLGLGDIAGVVQAMEEAATASGAWDVRYWALPEGARILVKAGALDLAERLVEADGEPPFPSTKAAVYFGRAAIAEARGQTDRALALYREASAWYSARGALFNDAHAVLGAARCQIAIGQTKEAAAKLQRVGAFFASLGATALQAEVDEIAGVSPPARARAGSG
jgi:class 3 adenylate cyclase/tetratricopeptide (TPR) repeat protein